MKEENNPDDKDVETAEHADKKASDESIKGKAAAALSDRIEALTAEIATLKAALAERKPPASIDAGAGHSSGVPLTKEALAQMTPAEIAKLDWADVGLVLSAR